MLSIVAFYFVTRKVLAAHRDEPPQSGTEELIGAEGEVRAAIDPVGQVCVDGALWRTRAADGQGPMSSRR